MNKRILSVLMVLVMLAACFAVPTAAVEEKDVIQLLNCDSAISGLTLSSNKAEGKGSLEVPMKGSFAGQIRFSKTFDVSSADTLAMDIYLSNPQKILPMVAEFMLELTSSGTFDNGEIAFVLHGDLKGLAAELQPGWNTVYFYFESVNYTTNPDPVDLTKINFMRMFGKFVEPVVGETLLIDNIRVCYTGGPSFEGIEGLTQFRGNNADVTVEVDGMEMPDPDNRHNEVSVVDGKTVTDKADVQVEALKGPSVSVNPDSQPIGGGKPSSSESQIGGADDSKVTVDVNTGNASSGMSLKLVITICAAVLVLAVAFLALVLVIAKSKKKDA